MTEQETKSAAQVMLAYAEGKQIECRYRHSSTAKWGPFVGSIVWDWGQYEFRLAPEPVEVEVWCHKDGNVATSDMIPQIRPQDYGWTLRRATIHPETK